MRHFLLSLLSYLARAVVRRQRSMIVGVTGSVGKTSAREAIRAVLATDWNVRSAPKNYNNEIGFPVAIIGGRAPGRSPFAWAAILLRGCALACVRLLRYPEVLVLEYGADHPGDIAYLTAIAAPRIGVITAVGPAHTEFFGSVERVATEKRRLITGLTREDTAVLNRDDERVTTMRDRTRARVLTYGFHAEADVRGIEYQVTYAAPSNAQSSTPLQEAGSWKLEAGDRTIDSQTPNSQSPTPPTVPMGIALKLQVGGSAVPVHLVGCIGKGHASAVLAAAAVGIALDMHLVEISHALEGYEAPPGRMRLIPGVKQTMLVDDTYNSSPLALASALEALVGIEVTGRRIAVLGDMLELGSLTSPEHRHMGELVAARRFDYVMTVGAASRHLAVGAREAGMAADRVLEFQTAPDAARFVQDLLHPGDIVLIKGSQSMRMERVVQELMADPLRAHELLCRQDSAWRDR
ncbi:UDP-N-acetylmuramoyl-tripeptide--D-alanyl-D-alanine ligase [Candidatus Uhrbacteria bacterium]|nr:UDP-N-acetylmuramoyl-tripeptide--D-alanyl-D-alanine ligase [Candidatus Uhrbacteria bacterium]